MNAFPLLGGRWGWGGWNRRQRKPAPDEAPPGSTRARRHADIGGQGVSAFPGAYRMEWVHASLYAQCSRASAPTNCP